MNENLVEPLLIDIDLSEYIPVRWNLGGHIMIFDRNVIAEGGVFSAEFDFKSVDMVNQDPESSIRFWWAIPKVSVPIDNLRFGYRKQGERYIIDDIEQITVSNSIGNVTFGIKEMGQSSPIFFNDKVVRALHLFGVAGRTFKPLMSY